MAQPALLFDADVQGSAGVPAADAIGFAPRRPSTPFGGEQQPAYEMSDAEAMTGTSGPRRAVRRPEPGALTRSMNELPPRTVQAIESGMRELGLSLGKRVTAAQTKQLGAMVAESLSVDEATARAAITRYMRTEAQKGATRN